MNVDADEAASQEMAQRVQHTQKDEFDMAEEEWRIMRDLQKMEKKEAEMVAAAEFASLQESQASEDAIVGAQHERERDASLYRDWENWELLHAAHESQELRRRSRGLQLTIRGSVEGVSTQSMSWTIQDNQQADDVHRASLQTVYDVGGDRHGRGRARSTPSRSV